MPRMRHDRGGGGRSCGGVDAPNAVAGEARSRPVVREVEVIAAESGPESPAVRGDGDLSKAPTTSPRCSRESDPEWSSGCWFDAMSDEVHQQSDHQVVWWKRPGNRQWFPTTAPGLGSLAARMPFRACGPATGQPTQEVRGLGESAAWRAAYARGSKTRALRCSRTPGLLRISPVDSLKHIAELRS
jgi:hypothetical protein